jgi:hypothetical protein
MCLTIRLSETGWGYAGIGDGGHGGQIGAAPHDLVAAGTRLPVGGDDLVATGAGGTVMDVPVSWFWPRKTRWNMCSSTRSGAR